MSPTKGDKKRYICDTGEVVAPVVGQGMYPYVSDTTSHGRVGACTSHGETIAMGANHSEDPQGGLGGYFHKQPATHSGDVWWGKIGYT